MYNICQELCKLMGLNEIHIEALFDCIFGVQSVYLYGRYVPVTRLSSVC